jgi:hypothetical protein
MALRSAHRDAQGRNVSQRRSHRRYSANDRLMSWTRRSISCSSCVRGSGGGGSMGPAPSARRSSSCRAFSSACFRRFVRQSTSTSPSSGDSSSADSMNQPTPLRPRELATTPTDGENDPDKDNFISWCCSLLQSGYFPRKHFRDRVLDGLPIVVAAFGDGHEAPLRIGPALANPDKRGFSARRRTPRLHARMVARPPVAPTFKKSIAH